MSLPTTPLPKHLLETFRKLEAYYEPMKTELYLCYCLVEMKLISGSLGIDSSECLEAKQWIADAIVDAMAIGAASQDPSYSIVTLDHLFPGPTHAVPRITQIQRRKDWLRYLLAPYE